MSGSPFLGHHVSLVPVAKKFEKDGYSNLECVALHSYFILSSAGVRTLVDTRESGQAGIYSTCYLGVDSYEPNTIK
jgi:hypothetical protein